MRASERLTLQEWKRTSTAPLQTWRQTLCNSTGQRQGAVAFLGARRKDKSMEIGKKRALMKKSKIRTVECGRDATLQRLMRAQSNPRRSRRRICQAHCVFKDVPIYLRDRPMRDTRERASEPGCNHSSGRQAGPLGQAGQRKQPPSASALRRDARTPAGLPKLGSLLHCPVQQCCRNRRYWPGPE